jgi:tRNA pseudouridine32 synthase/23S rRNA pseudouridine746 synthase
MVMLLVDSLHFVAADKPAGSLTVPSRLGDKDSRPCFGRTLERELGARLWPVHRLDLEVSGIVLFARDAAAHREANTWFENRQVHKTYEAWTEGSPTGLAADVAHEWRSLLVRGKRRAFEAAHGKLAVTRATFVAAAAGHLVWRLEPLTGRPHQLRVHLAAHGYPVLGDALYGATASFPAGIALRAVRLDFTGCPGAIASGLPAAIQTTGLGAPSVAYMDDSPAR